MSEPYIRSHFGVYARIVNAQDEILLIKKMRGPYTGMYDLPGGTPEPLELLEETLVREVREETGCAVTSFEQCGAHSVRYEYMKDEQPAILRHIAVMYRCSIQGEPRLDGDGEDAGGCIWVPLHSTESVALSPFAQKAVEIAIG